jgi:hypothetical protein
MRTEGLDAQRDTATSHGTRTMRDDHDHLAAQHSADDYDHLTVQHPADDEHTRGVQATVPSRARLGGRPDRRCGDRSQHSARPEHPVGDAPWDTVERLEDGDVLLYAMFWPAGKADLPPREFPLSLDDAQPGGLEGQPDHSYAERLGAQVNGWNMDLLIFYGGTDPTGVPPYHTEPSADARTAAQEQLARLVVPARV